MDKKISFFVLSNTGSPVKQLTMSKGMLTLVSLILMVGLLGSGYVLYDYYNLRKMLPSNSWLKGKLEIQKDEIHNQRRQIQSFANEINSLKAKLVDLNQFEKKIRIIANIEKSPGQEGFFGVGGSIPEDLNPEVEVESKHDSLMREMHEQIDLLETASASQKQDFESLLKYLENQRHLLAATPSISPVEGWISSRFGYRTSPFTGRREFHKGLDIAAPNKSPIVAPADGVISFVGSKGWLGKVVVLDHGHGLTTQYGHLDKSLKKIGDKVKRGEEIARVGSSGRTTGSHVHYSIFLNGLPVNPEKYIID